MKDSKLSQGACVCEDEDTTTYLRECSRKHECCHWHSRCALSPTHRFSTFLDFPFVPRFSFCCHAVIIHHNFLPVVILHTFCTEEIRHLRCGIYSLRHAPRAKSRTTRQSRPHKTPPTTGRPSATRCTASTSRLCVSHVDCYRASFLAGVCETLFRAEMAAPLPFVR